MASSQRSTCGVDSRAFRQSLGQFTTGVTVVTTTVDGDVHGMTANAFSSVSLDPPLVLVCVDLDTQMHRLLEQSRSLAITILSAEQRDLSDHFAGPGRIPESDKQFDGVRWEASPVFGHPVLLEGLAYLDCAVEAMYPGGDHSIVVGAVRDTGLLSGEEPLAYFRGGYRHLDAGSAA